MPANLTMRVLDTFQTKYKSIESFGKKRDLMLKGFLLFLELTGHPPSQFWEQK